MVLCFTITLLLEVYMIWYQICYCTCISESSKRDHFRPAYLLIDGRLERAGRAKRYTPPASGSVPVVSNGMNSIDPHQNSTLTTSIITVGDEILKLHSIGWAPQTAVVQNESDNISVSTVYETATIFKQSYAILNIAWSILQDKGSNEIVLKAMGRAINKNVMIAELIKNTSIGSTDITDMWERLWKKAQRIASQRDESCSPQAPRQNGLCGAALGFTLSEAIVTNACYSIFEDSGLLGKSYRNL
ncbi:hypothetical protein IFM89_026447 [Coptis chinensis]|uniref:DNA/RNA-binding protein Alba-like domain-containing protein n=1 Tax=Coptis chinensis TaxID=261450 RepID=A0A835IDF3_9MAGN|nr:hypothetical protein IFM89_026447 [Coptis chinensis]